MGARSNGRSYAQLNPGQIQCILLVGDHLTSKEIAKRLGISPHTVDQRVRHVLRLTGAASRREAARIIRHRIGLEAQYKDVGEPKAELPASEVDKVEDVHRRTGLIPPFPTYAGQLNSMGLGQRMFWIVAIAVGGCASTAMYLAGIQSLARVIRAH